MTVMLLTWSNLWHNLNREPGLYVLRAGGALLVLIAALVAGRIFHGRVKHTLQRTRLGPNPTVLLSRLARFGVYAVALLWVLAIFSVPFTALAAFVSVAALALSLAFQDLLRNLIAGIYLLAERPFNIGDQITVSGVTGVIDDIQMRVTYLHSERNERIIMPNQTVFTQIIVNNTVEGTRVTTFHLGMPRTENVEQAKGKILGALSGVTSVAATPKPVLQAAGLTADATQWTLTLRLKSNSPLSTVIDALAAAVPDITIDAATT
ncbi:MAG TPA: mechanosensitive ion channel domain-containing protein [Chloroflexota bacterium]|jgi:small-conductance mechanosensitive channel|nr:mechanosensitive ion channel domain-containing protein [Chloroflexota bacterium]